MDFLELAGTNNVIKGFDYYASNKVLSCEQIGTDTYKFQVSGSDNAVYNVILDLFHPKRSTCDCPYAEGSYIICKHKVAAYFYLFPEKAEEFKDYLNSDMEYYEDNDDEEYEDEYKYYSQNYYKEDIPSCYEELLNTHINNMSIDQLKEIVKNSMNQNRYYTFHYILKEEYKNYLENNKDYLFVEELNKKLTKFTRIRDYEFTNFDIELLNREEKEKLNNIYGDSEKIDQLIDQFLLNPWLAQYKGFIWIIHFYKNKLSQESANKITTSLMNTLNNLKHYGIRNTKCKSNVLIALNELNDFDNNYLAKSIVKNYKYSSYVKYVINKIKNTKEFYKKVVTNIDAGEYFRNKEAINVLLEFYPKFENKIDAQWKVLYDHSYYDFLFNKSESSLLNLIEHGQEEYINKIKNIIKTPEQYMMYYSCLKMDKELFELIQKEDKHFYYDKYLLNLKDTYSEEYYQYYHDDLFKKLETGMGREIYKEALVNVKYIRQLNNGKERVQAIYNELKSSSYNNRPALFDEFNKIYPQNKKR